MLDGANVLIELEPKKGQFFRRVVVVRDALGSGDHMAYRIDTGLDDVVDLLLPLVRSR